MFKTLNIYRQTGAIEHSPDSGNMEDMAQAHPFTPCGATQDKSVGWVPPRGEEPGALVESINGHRILKLMIETKSVPSATVSKTVQRLLAQIHAEAEAATPAGGEA